MIRKIAQDFVSRAKVQNWRGQQRDKLALEFFIGAWSLAQALGDVKLANNLAGHTFLIQVRGYSWVLELAEKDNG